MDIRLLQTNPEDLISFYGGETLSQSGRSNVFAIETLAGGENTPMQIKLKCVGLGSIQLSDYTGGVIATITATDVLADVGGTVFYAVDDIATNMRNALLNITYIADNFSVEVFAGFDSTITPIIGDYVLITSKGFSYEEYWLQLSGGGASYEVEVISYPTRGNTDPLTNDATDTVPLQIEIYEGSSVKYGDPNDFPDSSARLGSSVLTVAKTYISGEKFMFNINAPFMRDNFFNAPPNFGYIGFFDTGTLKRIRYDVRVNRGGNYQTIFRSGVKFLLNSYGRQVEPPYTLPGDGGSTDDMQFVYALEPTQLITVRTLTNTPPTFITTNGLIVLSFLFKNSAPGVVLSAAFNIYTQSGAYIDTIVFASIEAEDAGEVVSMMIPVFYLVYYYPNAGIIDAVIYANDTPRTYPKRYYVRPENLHETEYLMFLNQLGGWDCFNFDTIRTEEVRAERSTYAKGGILDNRLASAEMRRSFETVYNSEISKVYTLRSAPITDDVALWLEELAKSTVVYDKNNRYVIITDFALTISPENRDAQILTVKFKYSYEWQ